MLFDMSEYIHRVSVESSISYSNPIRDRDVPPPSYDEAIHSQELNAELRNKNPLNENRFNDKSPTISVEEVHIVPIFHDDVNDPLDQSPFCTDSLKCRIACVPFVVGWPIWSVVYGYLNLDNSICYTADENLNLLAQSCEENMGIFWIVFGALQLLLFSYSIYKHPAIDYWLDSNICSIFFASVINEFVTIFGLLFSSELIHHSDQVSSFITATQWISGYGILFELSGVCFVAGLFSNAASQR